MLVRQVWRPSCFVNASPDVGLRSPGLDGTLKPFGEYCLLTTECAAFFFYWGVLEGVLAPRGGQTTTHGLGLGGAGGTRRLTLQPN